MCNAKEADKLVLRAGIGHVRGKQVAVVCKLGQCWRSDGSDACFEGLHSVDEFAASPVPLLRTMTQM